MSMNEEEEFDLRASAASSEWGVRDDGEFVIPDIEEIITRMEDRLEAYLPEYDPAPGSPEQQLLEVFAMELEANWESQRELYYAGYFEQAFGEHLDRLLALAGVGRLVRQGAGGEVTFTAAGGVGATADRTITIPAGTRVAAPSTAEKPAIPFKTTEVATLEAGANRVERVPIKALEPYETDAVGEEWLGQETNLPPNTITRLTQPIAGIGSVTNPLATGSAGTRTDGTTYNFRRGRDRETDSELKERYRNQLGFGGKASLQNIRAAVAALDVVDNVGIEENVTMNDNRPSGGLPEKSFRVTVLAPAGYNDQIAQTIIDTRSAGIEAYGDVTGTGTVYGDAYTASFNMAGQVDVYADVDLAVTAEFPTDGVQRVQDRIINYIGGTTTTGEDRSGTPIGDDIAHSQVLSACMIEGVWDADVAIGTSFASVGTGNIAIDAQQVARTAPGNIDVLTTQTNIP